MADTDNPSDAKQKRTKSNGSVPDGTQPNGADPSSADAGSTPRSARPARASGTAARARKPAAAAQADLDALDPKANVIELIEPPERRRRARSNPGDSVNPAGRDESPDRTEAQGRARHPRPDSPASNVAFAASHALPDTVLERFAKVGNTLYFPDGEEALKDHGHRITTQSENTVVIQSIAAIAQHRGVRAVKFTQGTDSFKAQAWQAFRLAGIDVDGYQPTIAEQQRLARSIAARQQLKEGELMSSRSSGSGERTGAQEYRQGDFREGNSDRNYSKENVSKEKSNLQADNLRDSPFKERNLEDPDLIVGRLAAHGAARYQRREGKQMSYYVTLDTPDGPRELWGVDLERAIRKSLSQVTVGTEVGLRKTGSETVKVPVTRYDTHGREIGKEELAANRNTWSLERKDFLDHRADMANTFRDPDLESTQGIKRFAELEGSYLKLQLAQEFARAHYSPENAAAFIQAARAKLAENIAFGKPLETVPLRDRAPDRDKQRTVEPTPTL